MIASSWYDSVSGLCWQDPPNPTAIDWDSAVSYCPTLGGDWRMPTINELRSLVRTGTDAECYTIWWDMDWTEQGDIPADYCGVSDFCLNNASCYDGSLCNPDACGYLLGPGTDGVTPGCYWDAELHGQCNLMYWSSFEVSNVSSSAWEVGYHYGFVSNSAKSNSRFVRCVR
jgi:hypothetical protein